MKKILNGKLHFCTVETICTWSYIFPAGNYMFQFNNRKTTRSEICSKLTAGFLFIQKIKRCIQNPVEHLRWSFLWIQLMAESTEAAGSHDTLLHHSVFQYFQTEASTTTKNEKYHQTHFLWLVLVRLTFRCTRSKKCCSFSKLVF